MKKYILFLMIAISLSCSTSKKSLPLLIKAPSTLSRCHLLKEEAALSFWFNEDSLLLNRFAKSSNYYDIVLVDKYPGKPDKNYIALLSVKRDKEKFYINIFDKNIIKKTFTITDEDIKNFRNIGQGYYVQKCENIAPNVTSIIYIKHMGKPYFSCYLNNTDIEQLPKEDQTLVKGTYEVVKKWM